MASSYRFTVRRLLWVTTLVAAWGGVHALRGSLPEGDGLTRLLYCITWAALPGAAMGAIVGRTCLGAVLGFVCFLAYFGWLVTHIPI
jgi:hypothetical protein